MKFASHTQKRRYAFVSAIFCLLTMSQVSKADQITIISPHQKSLQEEIVSVFKEHYKQTYGTDIEVNWTYQGGTSDALKFIRTRAAQNPDNLGLDVLWGGGSTTFTFLKSEGLLASYTLPDELQKQVPPTVAGISIRDGEGQWYGAALSTFGIFYNKKVVEKTKIKEPETWEDLGSDEYFDRVLSVDPRHSGSVATVNNIILEGLGWEESYRLQHRIAGNSRQFSRSSSEVVMAVRNANVAAGFTIDFYAFAKIDELGPDKLGFAIPASLTVLDPDPVAIFKGAPNRKEAERFVEFLLSNKAQSLLVLPVGAEGGPKSYFLGRMPVNQSTYELTKGSRTIMVNPYEFETMVNLDIEKTAKLSMVRNDLYGALFVDPHKDLKQAWKKLIDSPQETRNKYEERFYELPLQESDVLELSEKWSDEVFRNEKINEWRVFTKQKFDEILKAPDLGSQSQRNYWWVLGVIVLMIIAVVVLNGRKVRKS